MPDARLLGRHPEWRRGEGQSPAWCSPVVFSTPLGRGLQAADLWGHLPVGRGEEGAGTGLAS